MPRYKLRTLLIVSAIGPPLLAVIYFTSAALARIVERSQREDWQQLILLATSLSCLISLLTVVAAISRRAGGSA